MSLPFFFPSQAILLELLFHFKVPGKPLGDNLFFFLNQPFNSSSISSTKPSSEDALCFGYFPTSIVLNFRIFTFDKCSLSWRLFIIFLFSGQGAEFYFHELRLLRPFMFLFFRFSMFRLMLLIFKMFRCLLLRSCSYFSILTILYLNWWGGGGSVGLCFFFHFLSRGSSSS